jgi:thioredoxin reductase
LALWHEVLGKHNIQIRENSRVEAIAKNNDVFDVRTADGQSFKTRTVLIAIGRRGTPRKLNVPGENLEKVAYRLLEPEHITGKNVLVVGGGDSAIESALLLAEQNNVTLSYRGESFGRIKPKNLERIEAAASAGSVDVRYSSTVTRIEEDIVVLGLADQREETLPNDLVYIFAGGELPTEFLQKAGISITRRFGHAILPSRRKRS